MPHVCVVCRRVGGAVSAGWSSHDVSAELPAASCPSSRIRPSRGVRFAILLLALCFESTFYAVIGKLRYMHHIV